eukprot:gnl/TRDRNA2_/TRDRNA2_73126_c0_seq1.p1 gnl/TRDRNA2_/TRDRNA2_73126_c0~~gnl/TRDRNA2_/TRDRNA2_73126_c0_seq1.p1  ORF type:complete len:464 (-),score=68.26 gnl/TRDRNA2_/TRDRNA2_73126_c0_seq1:64-1410(-)
MTPGAAAMTPQGVQQPGAQQSGAWPLPQQAGVIPSGALATPQQQPPFVGGGPNAAHSRPSSASSSCSRGPAQAVDLPTAASAPNLTAGAQSPSELPPELFNDFFPSSLGGPPSLHVGSKQTAADCRGLVAQITGRSFAAVDQVQFSLRDGSVRTYAPYDSTGSAGQAVGPLQLQQNELIVAVSQESADTYLGNAIAFFTSLGNVLCIDGLWKAQQHHFAAAAGSQVCGLQFKGSRLTGILTEPAPSQPGGAGSVSQIYGSCGTQLERVQLQLVNGAVLTYGGTGGSAMGPWSLKYGELIIAVSQEDASGCLGNSIAFYTSFGNVLEICGTLAKRNNRFVVPTGSQIAGLQFSGSMLSGVVALDAIGSPTSAQAPGATLPLHTPEAPSGLPIPQSSSAVDLLSHAHTPPLTSMPGPPSQNNPQTTSTPQSQGQQPAQAPVQVAAQAHLD